MYPEITYELKIEFPLPKNSVQTETREHVKAWLVKMGVESFVDGILDDLNIPQNYEELNKDFFEARKEFNQPIAFYKFDEAEIQDWKLRLTDTFGTNIQCSIKPIVTRDWTHGWQDYFQPIATEYFYIYPPWRNKGDAGKRIPLVIDPGLAFGTGQHATTQLCVQMLERIVLKDRTQPPQNFLDVGCGSGILAIAMAKAGVKETIAVDIDTDAIIAARENAEKNDVSYHVSLGSADAVLAKIQSKEYDPFELVVANILAYVLKRIMPELAACVAVGGEIVMSGLLTSEEDSVVACAKREGLEYVDRLVREDWSCLRLIKRS